MPPSNYDAGPWREVSREKGFRTVETADFDAFCLFVNRGFGTSDNHYIWRGQRDASWEILSSLGRTGKKPNALLAYYQRAVARCTHVEYNISGHGEAAEEAKLRLWSLGQHHGLFTPLTDWTLYPYVALFFAFAEASAQTNPRAVYALNWDAVQAMNFTINQRFDTFRQQIKAPPYSDEFKKYLLDSYGGNFGDDAHLVHESRLSAEAQKQLCGWEMKRLKERALQMYESRNNENPRIHSQGGMHLYTPEDTSIETWIRRNVEAHPDAPPFTHLTKILLPNDQRPEILRGLNRMNVNYLSLFPDHEGAARHCNMTLLEQQRVGLREY